MHSALKRINLMTSAFVILAALIPGTITAQHADQDDWSQGPAENPPASVWTSAFEESESISWLAIEGQLTLGSQLADEPLKNLIDSNAGGTAGLAVGDIDGDGNIDVIGAGINNHTVAWWKNEGNGMWSRTVIAEQFFGAASVQAVDLDGDGDLDVIGAALDGDEVAWFENQNSGQSWIRSTVSNTVGRPHWVSSADIDNDGWIDLVCAALESNDIRIFFNDGVDQSQWVEQIVDESFFGSRHVEVGDVDGDGDADLVGAALEIDEMAVWINEGGEPINWVKTIVSDSFGAAHGAKIFDLDRDGDLDIVGAAYSSPFLKWWRNDGGDPLVWTEFNFGSIFSGGLVPEVGDFDGDNDLDVVATSDRFGQVHWWQNEGGESLVWTNHILAMGVTNAWPVAVADFDGYGSLGIVAGGNGTPELAWWRVGTFLSEGVLTSSILEIEDGLRDISVVVEGDRPAGTSVSIEVRASTSVIEDAAWISVGEDTSVSMVRRGPCFFQYRLKLATANPLISPVVSAFSVTWTPYDQLPEPRNPWRRIP